MTDESSKQEKPRTDEVSGDGVANVRPSRLSMEGYIYNANNVLVACLDPNTKEVPVELFERCKGVVVITMVQVGALVTLQYGTGLLLKKTENGWSAPCAVSMGGTSFGAIVGGKRDNMIIFLMDEESVKDFAVRPQSRISLDAAVAAGKVGAGANIGNDLPKHGTVTFTLSQGAFAGLAVEMFTLEAASRQNEIFYDKEGVKAKDIIFQADAVEIPSDSQVKDVQEKLDKLARGETWKPSDDEINRSRHFAQEAKRKSELYSSGHLDVSGRSGGEK